MRQAIAVAAGQLKQIHRLGCDRPARIHTQHHRGKAATQVEQASSLPIAGGENQAESDETRSSANGYPTPGKCSLPPLGYTPAALIERRYNQTVKDAG